ncbi:MAG: fibronectin type III domain-containing protein, partial [Candidatus Dadabacteria bacterium]
MDTDGSYDGTSHTCSNVDCHNNATTPDWYTGAASDTTPPAWSGGDGLTVTDTATDGDLQITWNAASDAGSPPVVYDLYRASGSVADACASGTRIAQNLGTTSYLDTGLTNGSTYSYCVRAKDQASPANTADSATRSGSPTAPGGGSGTVRYYQVQDNGTNLASGVTTNLSACGSTTNQNINGLTSPGVPNAVGLLNTSGNVCGSASSNNRVDLQNGANGSLRYMAAWFYDQAETTTRTYTAKNTNRFRLRGGDNNDVMRIYLAALDSSGNVTL